MSLAYCDSAESSVVQVLTSPTSSIPFYLAAVVRDMPLCIIAYFLSFIPCTYISLSYFYTTVCADTMEAFKVKIFPLRFN
jgi:hypothetical protein